MHSCHEEGVRDRYRAGIKAADPAKRGIGSFDASSIPVANILLVTEFIRNWMHRDMVWGWSPPESPPTHTSNPTDKVALRHY
eukprot:gene124-biopygen1047